MVYGRIPSLASPSWSVAGSSPAPEPASPSWSVVSALAKSSARQPGIASSRPTPSSPPLAWAFPQPSPPLGWRCRCGAFRGCVPIVRGEALSPLRYKPHTERPEQHCSGLAAHRAVDRNLGEVHVHNRPRNAPSALRPCHTQYTAASSKPRPRAGRSPEVPRAMLSTLAPKPGGRRPMPAASRGHPGAQHRAPPPQATHARARARGGRGTPCARSVPTAYNCQASVALSGLRAPQPARCRRRASGGGAHATTVAQRPGCSLPASRPVPSQPHKAALSQ
mmetsp:Transcript_15245/g.32023  ORF Transcript_15245/g.32023 Transcript_15245/m.32023 type:complete len:278 (-) Transcript_15245:1346-2179(-)